MTIRAFPIRAGARLAATLLMSISPAALAAQAGAECADCHDAVVKAFAANPHAGARHDGAIACASCHAGAAKHAESGDPAHVFRFGTASAEQATEACLHCHARDARRKFWRGSAHEVAEVSCTKCHAVHGGHPKLLASASQGATCFSCHFDVRADVMKRSAHPLRDGARAGGEGRMTCSSCHNPHGAPGRALVDARSVNDKCYQCHVEKRAPVLWEHSPVKEDCLVCHTPHGSSNERLLTSRIPRLCQQCHMQGRHQSGALAPTSAFAFNRSCLNCHPMVHGSNHPSGPVLQR
jgi:DmsE family decaheme c-type cytochrome